MVCLLAAVSGRSREISDTFVVKAETVQSRLFPGVEYKQPIRPKIGLALSGGGLKGLAHIGVLQMLEESNIPVDYITGTSSGSIIGGLYALGYTTEQLDSIAKAINYEELFIDQTRRKNLFISQKEQSSRYLLDVRFDDLSPFIPISFTSGQRIGDQLTQLVLKSPFNFVRDYRHFEPEFHAVSTELETGNRVVISQGNIVHAIRASMAIPMVLSPVQAGKHRLIDGGVADNIPIDLAKDIGSDMVIAVDVRAKLYEPQELKNMLTVADQVINILMNTSREEVLDNADVVIAPDFQQAGGDGGNPEAEEAVRLGREAAQQQLQRIQERYRSLLPQSNEIFIVDNTAIHGLSILQKDQVQELIGPYNLKDQRQFTAGEIDTIISNLYKSGYFSDVLGVIDTSGNSRTLEFHLQEYPEVDEVTVEGVTLFPPASVESDLMAMQDIPYNPHMLRDLLTKMLRRYRAHGFSKVTVDTVRWDKKNGHLTIRVDEGTVQDVTVTGNDLTREIVITRESVVRRGEVVKQEKIHRSLTNIYSTGLFDYVGAEFFPDSSQQGWTVNYAVEEKKYLGVRFGYRIDNHRGNAGLLTLEHRNLLGSGVRASLDTKIGDQESAISAQFTSHRFFKTYLTYDLRGGYRWTRYRIYDESPVSQTFSFARKRHFVKFSLGHQLARLGLVDFTITSQRVFQDGPQNIERYNQNYNLTSLSFQSIIDTKDRAAFPRRGNYQRIYYESATARLKLAGDVGYTKFEFLSEWYFTFLNRNTIHPRMRIGLGDEAVPFSEWFTIGGIHSVFGLYPYELWAQKILVGSLEYRYRLPVSSIFDLNIYVRYDLAGSTNASLENLQGIELFNGHGLGIGVLTPAGPLNLAYGNSSLGERVLYFEFGWHF